MGRFALLLLSGVVLACLVPEAVEALDETFVASEAQFAVEELRGLSDSGVYDSLSLAEMLSSSVEDGTYHSTTTLNLALQSPYFESGKAIEDFEMMVLTHKEDKVKSLAIDEFPQMTDAAVEEFLIKKTVRKKAEREKAFRLLEVKALLSKRGEIISGSELRILLGGIDSDGERSARIRGSLDVQKRLVEPFITEERALSNLSLGELYDVSLSNSVSGGAWSDYQIERAHHILDASLSL